MFLLSAGEKGELRGVREYQKEERKGERGLGLPRRRGKSGP